VQARESQFCLPIAGRVDLDFGAMLTGVFLRSIMLPGMHHYTGPVHVELKLHIAFVDQLALGDSQFNNGLIIAAGAGCPSG
jgi:hypothetical protein